MLDQILYHPLIFKIKQSDRAGLAAGLPDITVIAIGVVELNAGRFLNGWRVA